MILTEPRIIVPTRCPDCGKWRTRPRRMLRNPRRYLPRWRRPSLLQMAGGIQVGTSGVVVGSSGVVVTGADDTECCCEDGPVLGPSCANCDGNGTPLQYLLSFSGIETQVCNIGVGNTSDTTDTEPNQDIVVTQGWAGGGFGSNCGWSGTIAVAGSIDTYGPTCADYISTINYTGWNATMVRAASNFWRVVLRRNQVVGAGGAAFFGELTTSTNNCTATETIANTHSPDYLDGQVIITAI